MVSSLMRPLATRELRRSLPLWVLFVAALISGSTHAQTPVTITPPNLAGPVTGKTNGSVEVGADGGASFSTAIEIPPGTAGRQPALQLSYNSQSGYGVMGRGWALGGLSTITRCPKTIHQDGVRRGVALSPEDQFCLDGQRLLLVTGIHGQNAEYRTQIDSFSRIKSFGADVDRGPDKFEVRTKQGLILTYGGTVNSTIEAAGSTTVMTWAISRSADQFGNYIDYSYTEDSASGEYNISRIRYTGNSVSGLVPYNAINFLYEARPDPTRGYVAGSQRSRTRRLTNIQTRIDTTATGTGGVLVRDYRINYALSPNSGRSLVDKITECDGSGNCLPATAFKWTTRSAASNTLYASGSGNWGGPAVEFVSQSTGGTPSEQVKAQVATGDFNGDGATDLMRSRGDGRWQVCIAGNGAFACTDWAGPVGKNKDVATGDFNGDGRTDIGLYPKVDSQANWEMCLSTGTSFSCTSWPGRGAAVYTHNGIQSGHLVGDFTGDGRDDIALASYNGGQYLCESLGTRFKDDDCRPYPGSAQFVHYAAYYSEETIEAFAQSRMAGDLDGDGRTDYVQLIGTRRVKTEYPTGGWSGIRATDTGFVGFGIPSTGRVMLETFGSAGATRFMDHTSDPVGLQADLFVGFPHDGADGTGPAKIEGCRSLGTALQSCVNVAGATEDNALFSHVSDFDGDGRADARTAAGVCQIAPSSADLNQYSYTCNPWTLPPPTSDAVDHAYGDFNGDGRSDNATYIKTSETTGYWRVELTGHGGFPDRKSVV